MKTPIVKLDNGQMEVTISYDVTSHGHSFAPPRLYDVAKITKMIRSKSVQEEIKNNYCKGFYGHSNRNAGRGYIPTETNDNGERVEPVCVTKALSIDGNMITHTQRIFNTEEGLKVQKLAENGAIGFSNVWNIEKGKFYGYDAVLSPNFHGNSVILDSICTGECKIDDALDQIVSDAIGDDADEELTIIAKDLLTHQEDVQNAIRIKEHIQGLRAQLDAVAEEAETAKEEAKTAKDENKALKEDNETLKKDNKALSDEKELFISEKETLEDSIKTKQETYEKRELMLLDSIKSMESEHKATLDSLGMAEVNGSVVATEQSLRALFSQGDFNGQLNVSTDDIETIKLRKVNPKVHSKALTAIGNGWGR